MSIVLTVDVAGPGRVTLFQGICVGLYRKINGRDLQKSKMSAKIMVDTTEDAASETLPNVEVVAEGNKLVTIDTANDTIEHAPTPPAAPVHHSPPPAQPRPKRAISPPVVAKPVPEAPTAKKMLDGQSAFQDALRETVPSTPRSADAEDGGEEEEEVYHQYAPETKELPSGMQAEEEEPESDHEEVEEDEEEEEDDESEEEKDETPGEDEDMVKMRLIEEINTMMADGFLPPQSPSFNMDIRTLTKIKEYQEAAASDAFGIQLIGWGWINVIGILEQANDRFDPAARIFGPGKGLKLNGASEKVSKNIRRYRASFKYLWKKVANKKLEEYSPLITMALVTLDILKSVHIENVRKEMRETAAAELNRPGAYADAMKMASRPEEPRYRQPPQPQLPPPRPSQDDSSPPPARDQDPYHEPEQQQQQPPMRAVDDIVIPESDNDEEAATPEAVDDDEIEVAVPKGKARKSRKRVGKK